MSKKDSSQIEKMAISKLEASLLKSDVIDTYISKNDKTPSFDGYLLAYKGKKTKDNLIGRINVQVKGTETWVTDNTTKYQVEISDLNNYRNDNGCVFFLVSLDFDNDNCKIFYNCLQILDLNRILEKANGQKTIAIELDEFPKDDPIEIANILVNFVNDSLKQRSFINNTPTLEDLRSRGTEINQLIMGGTIQGMPANDFDLYITTHPVYVYAKLEKLNVEIPVDKVLNSVIKKTVNGNVSVNGKTYYDSYDIVTEAGVRKYHVGKSLVFDIRDNFTKINVKICPKGYLSDYIRDTEFLIDFICSKNISFNGGKIQLSTVDNAELSKYQARLQYYRDINIMLCKLGVTEELDCSKVDENDNKSIRNFVNTLLYNSSISFPQFHDDSMYGLFSIANLKIMISINRRKDGYYDISSFFDDHPIVMFSDDDCDRKNPIPASQYLLLSEEALSEASNLDCEKIYKDIIEKGTNLNYVARVQLFMLQVLNAYDRNIKHQDELLLLAQRLCSWISPVYSEGDLQTLNHLQIIKRIREFNKDEISTLNRIIETNSEDIIKCGAYILLDDYHNAQKCLEKLSEKEQEEFKKFPIYYFVKSHNQPPKS